MNTTPRKYYDTVLDGSSTPSGKKLTPMAAHIRWLQDKLCLPNSATSYMALTSALEHAISLLPEEKEMVVNTFHKGTNEIFTDTELHLSNNYFTNNYQQ